MSTLRQVKAWLDQAKYDLGASRVADINVRDCHRRYWIQQSYEKAIKAYALMRWEPSPGDEGEFRRVFLLRHSPLRSAAEPSSPLSKALWALTRMVSSFVDSLGEHASALRKIDDTLPSTNPNDVSYRYPLIFDGEHVAPGDFEEWDPYQGNLASARAAVDELLKSVNREFSAFARRSK